ncbi:MAG: DNA-binding response regulator [Anaerolineales bacterium]|nr:response regulator transcription factor [Anaerolineae bacterium]PWB54304.1 MAG: DNA-binding response regulator [Anaerolineales bacterium]
MIVDDHPMVRSGLKDFLAVYDWMEPVGEAQNGIEAVDFCREQEVDVVLMDLVMPLINGSEATRRILALGKPIKVIVITSFHEHDLVQQALKAGASSYLLKNVSADELANAIQAAHGGYSILAPEATRALIHTDCPEPRLGNDLTQTERRILAALTEGMTNEEISRQLSISVSTVKFHLTNIFSKLGARNRVEATSLALEHKLV